jgi:hypothetical protein
VATIFYFGFMIASKVICDYTYRLSDGIFTPSRRSNRWNARCVPILSDSSMSKLEAFTQCVKAYSPDYGLNPPQRISTPAAAVAVAALALVTPVESVAPHQTATGPTKSHPSLISSPPRPSHSNQSSPGITLQHLLRFRHPFTLLPVSFILFFGIFAYMFLGDSFSIYFSTRPLLLRPSSARRRASRDSARVYSSIMNSDIPPKMKDITSTSYSVVLIDPSFALSGPTIWQFPYALGIIGSPKQYISHQRYADNLPPNVNWNHY